MMNNKQYFLVLLLAFFSLQGWSQENFNKVNFAEMYDINGTRLHPVFQCFHENDTSSTLFYQIDLSELTYLLNSDSVYFAKAKIHYQVYYNYKAKNLLDSGSIFIDDAINYGKDKSTIGFFSMPLLQNNKYVIYIEFTDINENYYVKKLMEVDKSNSLVRQNFFIQGTDQLPYLQNYIDRELSFQLASRSDSPNEVQIQYYKPKTTIARPPMFKADNSEREVNMDTFYTLPLVEGLSNTLLLQDQGFYHFTLDAAQPSGFTLFQFTSAYPYVTSSMQMLMPLRYITSGNEFKSIFESKDKKKAVDDFWVKIAGDEARAKSLIKLYYNRVQNANICFTSDKEGWMTDRGMVYIVFGAPNIVYRDSEMETWKYGSTQSNQSITFNFYRADNPFTNNEFTLDRSQNYSINWNNAIEVWRR